MLGGEGGVKWQGPTVTPAKHRHYLDAPYFKSQTQCSEKQEILVHFNAW